MNLDKPSDPRIHPAVSADIGLPQSSSSQVTLHAHAEPPDRAESRLAKLEHQVAVLQDGISSLIGEVYALKEAKHRHAS